MNLIPIKGQRNQDSIGRVSGSNLTEERLTRSSEDPRTRLYNAGILHQADIGGQLCLPCVWPMARKSLGEQGSSK